jgi:hypothetical protein
VGAPPLPSTVPPPRAPLSAPASQTTEAIPPPSPHKASQAPVPPPEGSLAQPPPSVSVPVEPGARRSATEAARPLPPAPPLGPRSSSVTREQQCDRIEQQLGGPAGSSQAAAPTGTTRALPHYMATRSADLRAGPGRVFPVTGSISLGERYPVVDTMRYPGSAWFKIRLNTGAEAWVAGALGTELRRSVTGSSLGVKREPSETGPAPGEPPRTSFYAGRPGPLRAQPGRRHSLLGRLTLPP